MRALYGLLMLLPQSEAFITLKRRLDCVPSFYNKIDLNRIYIGEKTNNLITDNEVLDRAAIENTEKCDFKALLEHFVKIQEKQKAFKKNRYL